MFEIAAVVFAVVAVCLSSGAISNLNVLGRLPHVKQQIKPLFDLAESKGETSPNLSVVSDSLDSLSDTVDTLTNQLPDFVWQGREAAADDLDGLSANVEDSFSTLAMLEQNSFAFAMDQTEEQRSDALDVLGDEDIDIREWDGVVEDGEGFDFADESDLNDHWPQWSPGQKQAYSFALTSGLGDT